MDKNTLYIEDDTVTFGQYDKPLYRDCDMVDTYTKHYPDNGVDQIECKADSLYVVSYPYTWHTLLIVHHVCERHLQQLINQAIALQWAIVDERKGKV